MNIKQIVIGSDHGGFILKGQLIRHLESRGITVTDVGTYSADSCNYPDIADALCKRIQSGEFELGILVCGTGIGMSIAANKHSGIRAAACENTFSARMTRMHNNANVLCLGARVHEFEKIVEITDAFLGAEFLGGRHQRRVDMLETL